MKKTIIMICLLLLCTRMIYAEQTLPEQIYEKATVVSVELSERKEDATLVVQEDYLVGLKIMSGEDAGKQVSTLHTITSTDAFPMHVKVGDQVVVFKSYDSYYITDYYRATGLYILIGVFILAILWVGRFQGVKTLITLALTGLFVLYGLIPLMMRGYNPIVVTIGVATIVTAITIGVITGFTKKSLSAVIGTLAGVILAASIAMIVTHILNISGLSSEEAMMLIYIPQAIKFDAPSLLLSGIILGALGAVMDVAMSIASSIEEIKEVKPDSTWQQLYNSGMNIGRDVMGTMTNTLILAYTGSFLPLILLQYAYETPAMRLMNLDLIATEIVRALSGSIGIVMCIPITAFVSAVLSRNHQGGKIER